MRYFIFIDESGSLNNFNEGYFSISGIIFPEDNFSKLKNWSKRKINKIRELKGKGKNFELKASKLRSARILPHLYSFYNNLADFAQIFCVYINNNNINKHWLEDKNATFNFMVKKLIIKGFINNVFVPGDKIQIIADKRHESVKYFWSINEYLNNMFVQRNLLKFIDFKYIDSRKSWEITIADWISFINYRKLKAPLIERSTFVEIY